jgi:hypothetical protein
MPRLEESVIRHYLGVAGVLVAGSSIIAALAPDLREGVIPLALTGASFSLLSIAPRYFSTPKAEPKPPVKTYGGVEISAESRAKAEAIVEQIHAERTNYILSKGMRGRYE